MNSSSNPINTWRKNRLVFAISQALLLGTMGVQAATITVDSTADADPSNTTDGKCTLREAIEAATTDVTVDTCAAGNSSVSDRIIFDSNLTTSPTTITLAGSALKISRDPNNPSKPNDLSIDGAQNITIDANNQSKVITVNNYTNISLTGLTITGGSGGGIGTNNYGVTITLTNCTITGNSTSGAGGGIFVGFGTTLTLMNSTISGNSAPAGGGIFALNNTDINLINTTVSGNSAAGSGGGIYDSTTLSNNINNMITLSNSTISGNTAGFYGGGIYAFNYGGKTTLGISNSVISDNVANSKYSKGGGISIHNISMNLVNSTVSGNTTFNKGGGLIANHGSSVNLTNSTISGNVVTYGSGGGIFTYNDGTKITLNNSILANSSNYSGSTLDCIAYGGAGPVIANAFNIIQADGCSTSAQQVDPLLGALANNGGPTLTQLPQTGSPAIDSGDQSVCPATDQRGYSRNDGKCDIGAVEVGATSSGDGNNSGGGSSFGNRSGGGGSTDLFSLLATGILWPLRRWRRYRQC